MKHIICSSFGKDSNATALLALQHGEPLDEIIYTEVMFSKEISGELPEHARFIYETAIPYFEKRGIPTRVLHAEKTYLDCFYHVVSRGNAQGKLAAFPLAGRCVIQRDCKVPPLEAYKESLPPGTVSYLGIAADEPIRLERLKPDQVSLMAKYGVTEQDAFAIRSISDRLCMEAQLSIIKDPQQLGQLYPTYVQKKRTTSNRTEVRKKLNFCLERATNYAQFLQMAQELGISVCQRGKHMTYLLDGAGRAIRDTSLADTDKFTYTGIMERLEDNAAEQQFIRERIAKILPNVSTFVDFAKLLQSEGVKIRVKKQTGQLLYKAADLDGTWVPADALGDGFTLAGLENTIKNKSENLDTNHSTPIAELYQKLTTNYPQSCDTSVRLTSRQICSAGKRGVLLQIHDSSGNPAKLMIDNSHIHTTPDGSVSADIGAAFSYDITYDDGTHGTIRGTDLIRQIDEENLTQPLIVSLTADQIMAMSLRGVTVHLPQYGIERLFIPERYVQRNVEQGSCAISLYPGWQYSYVPIGSENTRKSISGAELAQSLGGVVQVGTSESSLARRVANVERRAGIANAQELGKLLGSMADNGLHSAADFDKQISAYQREEMELRNEITELRSKSKIYAATAHNLQACRTYKSVWLEYASKPLAQKDTFYKQNEAALQAYSRAASQLDKMGISLGTEPEKVRQLVTETESRIADLIAELEIVRTTNQAIQEDKEKVEQIQSG